MGGGARLVLEGVGVEISIVGVGARGVWLSIRTILIKSIFEVDSMVESF